MRTAAWPAACSSSTQEMQDGGARPMWLGYLHAADVDAKVEEIKSDGGQVMMAPWDQPGVGRLAMVTGPEGAPFYLMDPIPPEGKPDAVSDVFSVDQPQHVRWNELWSSRPGQIDRLLQAPVRLVAGRRHGYGRNGQIPVLPAQRRRDWRGHADHARHAAVHVELLYRRRRHRPGDRRGAAPAAGRSSTVPRKSPAANLPSTRSTRRARCSASSARARNKERERWRIN